MRVFELGTFSTAGCIDSGQIVEDVIRDELGVHLAMDYRPEYEVDEPSSDE